MNSFIAILPGIPGHFEVLIILFVALLLFGNRIPGVARSLGRGIVEFRKGLKGEDDDENGKKEKIEGDSKSSDSGDKEG